jgi:uncharacterized membrane protein YdcZ (DUF606 family)
VVVRGSPQVALDASNIVGIVVLFVIGYYRSQNREFMRRLSSGAISALVGAIIAVVVVFLGG